MIDIHIPPEPIWRTVQGQNGWIAYDVLWLQRYALRWHIFVDGDKVTLNYYSSYEMPPQEDKHS